MSFYHLTENTNGNATYTSEKHNMAVEGTDTETGFSCVSTESNLQPEEEEDGGGYSLSSFLKWNVTFARTWA